MKKLRNIMISVLVLLLLNGCLLNEMRGIYDAGNGDMLWIKKGGEVQWSPLSKTKSDFVPMGVLKYDEYAGKIHLIMASSHPLLGTEMSYSEEERSISVNWKRLDGKEVKDRASIYVKREKR